MNVRGVEKKSSAGGFARNIAGQFLGRIPTGKDGCCMVELGRERTKKELNAEKQVNRLRLALYKAENMRDKTKRDEKIGHILRQMAKHYESIGSDKRAEKLKKRANGFCGTQP